MTDQTNSAEAEILAAVQTLMRQLETEQSWIEDLRKDLTKSESRAERLLTSVEAALHMLSIPNKRQMHFRLRQMRQDAYRQGRPTRDGRQRAMLHYIAEKAEGTLTSSEMRLHLKAKGLRATSQYISNQLSEWVTEGLLTRTAHGVYQIDPENAALRAIRFRKDRRAVIDEARASIREMRTQAEAMLKQGQRASGNSPGPLGAHA